MLRNAKVVSKLFVMFIVTKPARFVFTAGVPACGLKSVCVQVSCLWPQQFVSCLSFSYKANKYAYHVLWLGK